MPFGCFLKWVKSKQGIEDCIVLDWVCERYKKAPHEYVFDSSLSLTDKLDIDVTVALMSMVGQKSRSENGNST